MSFSAIRFFIATACCVGFIGLFSPASAAGSYVTGKELQKFCTSPFDTDYGYCAGFVTGVADILLSQDIGGVRACHKTAVKSQQLVDLVMSFMEHNPGMVRRPAKLIVADALARSFHCSALQ